MVACMSDDRDEEYRAWRRVTAPAAAEKSWLRRLTSPAPARAVQSAPAQQAAIPAYSFLHGVRNAAFVCPHCQERGRVYTQSKTVKAGVSGGKATAALLTGGFSLLATGLSRKQRVTEAWCGNCRSTWHF
jgi:hypothetical protein